MSKYKGTSASNLDEILGGGSMKDLINNVNGVAPVVSKEDKNSIETVNQTSNSGIADLDANLNYYLRAGITKQAVYIDVELVKLLEKLIYKLKYSGNVRTIPKSSLVCAILKTFLDNNEGLLK